MRLSVLAIVATSLMTTPALAASECRVIGNVAEFGVNMTGYFTVASGATCVFPIRIPGMMINSGISQQPSHGTLRKLNATTFTYTAARGYKGGDTFAIFGTGKGPYGSGTSIMTVNATIE